MFEIKIEHIKEIQRLGPVLHFMKDRCNNPKNKSYDRYGGRGVYICSEWLDCPEKFVLWCLQNGSESGKQLDRIDNDGPYSPDNCRWVTQKENCNNRSNTRFLTAFGETKTLSDWLEDSRCLYDRPLIANRLRWGWDAERAMTAPVVDRATRTLTAYGETKTWREWLDDPRVDVSSYTIKTRMGRGWTDAECVGEVKRKRGLH